MDTSLDLLKDLPLPDFFEEKPNKLLQHEGQRDRDGKHDKTYIKFCKWSALPTKERNPPTQRDFEVKHGLPHKYTTKFKGRRDFQKKRIKYFWEWMFDKFPDVVYGIYERAKNRSTSDAKIFIDLIGKQLEKGMHRESIKPLMIMGVPQEKIDQLFVPPKYDKAVEKTVQTLKAQDGEVVEDE